MKGGYRPGAGRKKGVVETKPRKLSEAREEAEQIRKLLAVGKKAKQKLLHEFLFRVANKDGKQKPLSVVEKKMMDQWQSELVAELNDPTEAGESEGLQPLEYMMRVMNDPKEDKEMRARMAIASAPYIHPRAGEAGKKEGKEEKAAIASRGKFAAGRAPLALVQ